jgi:excisionase family DNA binding protein
LEKESMRANPRKVKGEIRITARWPRLLCIDDAGEYLNISPKTIRNRLSDKNNPFPVRPKRFGKRVLFDRKDLDRYVDKMH